MKGDKLSTTGLAIAAALVLDGRAPIAAYAIAREMDERWVGATLTEDVILDSLRDLRRLATGRTHD